MRLENKVALITGGYGGMGNANGSNELVDIVPLLRVEDPRQRRVVLPSHVDELAVDPQLREIAPMESL